MSKIRFNVRLKYLTLAFFTMILGLMTRSSEFVLPELVTIYGGDTLWALLVFWLVRGLKPSLSVLNSAFIALGFSYFIEFSQFYHAPWIDAIRSTTLGGLVLGYGFQVSDLVCYSIGACFGFIASFILDGEVTE